MIKITNFANKIIPISQRDKRWANVPMGSQTPYTIGSMGCLMTCNIMITNALQITAQNPKTALPHYHRTKAINEKSGLMPLNGLGLTRPYPKSIIYNGYKTQRTDIDQLLTSKLSQGIPVIIQVDTDGPYNHWVIAIEQVANTYKIVDPLYGDTSTIKARYRGIILEALDLSFIKYLDYPRAIDLSYANPLSDEAYKGLKDNFLYAYIRASEGKRADTLYHQHVQACLKIGIPYAPYHFLRPASDVPIKTQFQTFREIIASYPRIMESIIDAESIYPVTPTDLYEFTTIYEQTLGEPLGIYSRAEWLKRHNISEQYLKGRNIYQANYYVPTPEPLPHGLTPAIWQCGQAGIEGHDHVVDINYIMKHLDQLKIRRGDPIKEGMIDLLPYIRGPHLSTYIMRMDDGREERYQYQNDEADPDTWYIVKNQQWEKWRLDRDGYIRLCMDTSPEPQDDKPVYYVVTAHDKSEGGIMFPRYMKVSETYTESPNHTVKFFTKADGQFMPQYSGENSNNNKLFYAKGNVIEIGKEGGEIHQFTKGIGRTGWRWDTTIAPSSSSINTASNPGTWIAQREIVCKPKQV